jgi:hypothetical protein
VSDEADQGGQQPTDRREPPSDANEDVPPRIRMRPVLKRPRAKPSPFRRLFRKSQE